MAARSQAGLNSARCREVCFCAAFRQFCHNQHVEQPSMFCVSLDVAELPEAEHTSGSSEVKGRSFSGLLDTAPCAPILSCFRRRVSVDLPIRDYFYHRLLLCSATDPTTAFTPTAMGLLRVTERWSRRPCPNTC